MWDPHCFVQWPSQHWEKVLSKELYNLAERSVIDDLHECLTGLKHRRRRKSSFYCAFRNEVVSYLLRSLFCRLLPLRLEVCVCRVGAAEGSGRFLGRDLNADWRKHRGCRFHGDVLSLSSFIKHPCLFPSELVCSGKIWGRGKSSTFASWLVGVCAAIFLYYKSCPIGSQMSCLARRLVGESLGKGCWQGWELQRVTSTSETLAEQLFMLLVAMKR